MNKSKILLIVLIPLIMCACPAAAAQLPAQETHAIKVMTSFYPVYIIAKNVARDVPGVSVENLSPSFTGCLHDYAVTSGDMKRLSNAQVLAVNGAGMESFLDRVSAQMPRLRVVPVSGGIPLIKQGRNEGANPHVWASISLYITQVKNFANAMEQIDPWHKQHYERNASVYIGRLEALRQRMIAELAPYKGRAIITFHEAFPYFAQEFGLVVIAVIEREPGSEPSARELADTITLIKRNGITALFSEPQYPSAAARAIAQETGAQVYVLDPAVTGPDDYDAYIAIMENNVSVLKKAFAR